ncbi:transcriptional regulator ATRX isoform X2 [Neodiprion pinetum]|uniref:transcriptional regulator ATRX isoform X2 n=1 Tax=Neodiprion pinetum TaxID=441929 RepID=UPI001EE13C88|nr:transcriptional regulator ATRX isoform X2 [Neodiprion pinetum]
MPIDVTKLESDYRAENYKDSKSIERKQLICATCGTDLSGKFDKPGGLFIHPLMTTLQCKTCSNFYGDGDFSMDEDGDDKYCRMCGNGGALYICGNKPCPYGFCHDCIERYVGKNSPEVQADNWKCLRCNCKPLWEVRAVCEVIVRENSRKRRKHNKKPTRGEVSKSDADHSLSEDLNNDFQNSKLTKHRNMRYRRSFIKTNELVKNLARICNSSDDSSNNENSNVQNRYRKPGDNTKAMLDKKYTKTHREHMKSLSSDEETTDFEEEEKRQKTHVNSRFKNKLSRVKSQHQTKHNNTTSSYSHRNKEKGQLAQKQPRITKPERNSRNPSLYSESSGHESANEFVKSWRQNNSKVLDENSRNQDLNIREKKSNNIVNPNSILSSKRLYDKFEAVIKPTELASIKPKGSNSKHDRFPSEDSCSSISEKKIKWSNTKICETARNMNSFSECNRPSKQYFGSENDYTGDSENAEITSKVSTSVCRKSEADRLLDNKSEQESNTNTSALKKSKTSFLLGHENRLLGMKKASMKHTYAKVANTKEYVNKSQARVIRAHINSFIDEMDKLGAALHVGARKISETQLNNNFTVVSAVSKTVLKCALTVSRCQRELSRRVEEFMEFYSTWCNTCNVSSILLNMDHSNAATGSEEDSPSKQINVLKASRNSKIIECSESGGAVDDTSQSSDELDVENLSTFNKSVHTLSELPQQLADNHKNITKGDISSSNVKGKSTVSDKQSDCESLTNSEQDMQNPVNAKVAENLNGNVNNDTLPNSLDCDVISECDSNEIFSEDENRASAKKPKKSIFMESLIESRSPNTSENQITESAELNSDESGIHNVAISPSIQQESLQSVDTFNNISVLSENQEQGNKEKLINYSVQKGGSQQPLVEVCNKNTKQLDSSVEDNFNDMTSPDHCKENEPTMEENSSDAVQSDDGDTTLELFDYEPETLIHDSSRNTNTDMHDMSDCETELVFTQDTNHVANKSDSLAKMSDLRESENKTIMEVENDNEVALSQAAHSPKELPSIETVTPEIDEIADANINENLSGRELRQNEIDQEKNNGLRHLDSESGTLEKVQQQLENNEIDRVDSNIPLPNNVEHESDEVSDKVEQENIESLKDDIPSGLDQTAAVHDSEEAIKKKILESDSEQFDDSTSLSSKSDDHDLRLNSDGNNYSEKRDSTDDGVTAINKNKYRRSNSPQLENEDLDIVMLNNLAKSRLLLSSDSSSTNSDDNIALVMSPSLDDLNSPSSEKQDEIYSNSIYKDDRTNSTCTKIKKQKFCIEKNYYYLRDKKLQMSCQVVIRRLKNKVLEQFTQLLGKSKEHQEWQEFKSLIDVDNIKKRKRGACNQSDSSSSSESSNSKLSAKGRAKKTKCNQIQEKEETLMDHLEKVKNGENVINFSENESDENNVILNTNTEDVSLARANELAKDRLIQSSDSEHEILANVESEEEKIVEDNDRIHTTKKDKKKKDKTDDESANSGSDHKNESDAEKGNKNTTNEENADSQDTDNSDSERKREQKKMKNLLAKRHWRLTDSDSSSEERKWRKSQLKEEDGKRDTEVENITQRKKRPKRRMLGSDSDSVKLTDLSDDDGDDTAAKKKKSGSESEDSDLMFAQLRKKRFTKRNTRNSDSDSESEQDEKPTKQKRKRIKKMDSDSDSDMPTNSQDTQGKFHRKNIRKVLKDKQVADVTKIAGKEEEERLKRIAERQKLYNEMYEIKLAREAKVDKLVLDFDEETKKELISVHEDLVKRLKPHQAQGIKFMWDACFESLERTKSTKGSGCIVAHCMGLGKTFQVVTLAHTLLTHPETGIKTIMVICPLSTVLNWVNEFKKWLGDINNDQDVRVYEMTKMKKHFERRCQLEKWQRTGGVIILGYEMFRILSNQKAKKMRKSMHEGILKCLVDPGPDLIVCDEGHLLKNEDTALSKAMRKVKTLRRIVLTGTPLQNNLVEYHCMVQFVKPNLLGTKKEFLNRFVNPITNGQFDDSTEYDVKLMKKRAHVLHKMLEGSVQRFDYSVLTPFLPPKQEYVITVRLADIQIKLYEYYLDNFSRKKVGAGTSLFADFQSLQRIWTHPIVLRMNAEKVEKLNEKKRLEASDSEGSLRDFLDDGSEDKSTTTSDSDIQSTHGSSDEKSDKPRRGTRANPLDEITIKSEDEDAPQAGEWWSQFVEPEHFEDLRISSKLVLLFAILKECEQIGDKVLVFSQSLYALSLIEEFLNKIDDETQRGTCSELIDGHTGSWSLGLDYFRLDGQTAPENRSQYCRIFNNPKNSRARLFLISTRAGGLGINLTAANRVIIFDASWNPSHDVQSIFRIYRFGQKKPCYVYRFLAQGTMEEKIYNRQVTKLSLSCRVVDEQQIERHYSNHDLAELYQFEPKTNKDKPTLNLPKDRLLAEIFRKYEDRIETFHEHDSLLENKAEEELDEEERKEAWKEYEDERTGRKVLMHNPHNQNLILQQQYNEMLRLNPAEVANRAMYSGINIENLQALIRKDYPNETPEAQTAITTRAIMEMYTYLENETIRRQHLAASNFHYPTVSNLGTTSYVDSNMMIPAQQQYALQQQQKQQQLLMQRDQQANYAKQYGNVRIGTSTPVTRIPPVVDLHIEDNDVIEVPTTPPSAVGIAPSSSVQATPVSAPAEMSKKQEE